MNPDKRVFFGSFDLQIPVIELFPLICPHIPPTEFIFKVEFTNPRRGGGEELHVFPPQIPSELAVDKTAVPEHYNISINNETIRIYTKALETNPDKSICSKEHSYSFSVMDLIDP